MNRHFWVLVHRYAGLYMAFFLLVAGLTGSIMAFEIQIQDWLNPPVKAIPKGIRLDELTLRDRAQALAPKGLVNRVEFFGGKPDDAYKISMVIPPDTATGKPEELLELTLNPYTGKEIAREKVVLEDLWPITRKNFIFFIVALHYRLALPGSIGVWLFGVAALLWTLDCFVGVYLTFPLSKRRLDYDYGAQPTIQRKSWWSRWKPSWQVKWRASVFRVNFDLHRAGGLWVWLMLLVLAWSSVGFNLGEQVYMPVMKTVFNMPDAPYTDLPALPTPQPEPAMSWRQAHNTGKRLMAEQANTHGIKVKNEMLLQYAPEKGVFMYAVNSDLDITDAGGGTALTFDGKTGKFLALSLPTGQNAGTTLHNWIFALHTALVWGLPFKIFLCLMGLVIAMLSITGVYIWLRKHRAVRLKRKVLA
ncbi:MAG: PepSY domain-containing protein [Methyloglobulus sp.]|nr:PepSY domain-containing protein [Methyloglobulus sp.]